MPPSMVLQAHQHLLLTPAGTHETCDAQAALDDSIERTRELVASKHDLQGIQKACSNAFQLYKRTRPPASAESVNRAKQATLEGIHPLLAAKVPVTAISGLEAQV